MHIAFFFLLLISPPQENIFPSTGAGAGRTWPTSARSSYAEEQNPQAVVEQFLALHGALSHATIIAESLTKAAATASGDASTADEDNQVVAVERRRRAASWVGAGLATDLSAFSLQPQTDPSQHRLPTGSRARGRVEEAGCASEGIAACEVTVVPGERASSMLRRRLCRSRSGEAARGQGRAGATDFLGED
jgi:hypothetical protein